MSTLLVISNPAARHLKVLDRLPPQTRIVVGESLEALANAAPDAEVVLCGGTHREILRELWPSMAKLRWVHALAAGLEGLLFDELIESSVPLTNSRGVFARSLGEFALAGMLHFAKDLGRMKRQQREAKWECFDVEELNGRTLGVFGHGSIGKETAKRAQAFGMKVIGLGSRATKAELDAMLAACDYLLVAAPLTPKTRGAIGDPELRRLKPGAVVINLGRGPVIDEASLIAALTEKRIRGAVLDVFDVEPLPAEHAFWRLENVLLSPHTADHTATWMDEAMQLFVENFEYWSNGEPLLNVADKKAGY
jgi:phosphoglycerate dehydrogenase-like enzyme